MKVTLENTNKIVTLVINGTEVPARIWEGVTANGIKCHAYVTRIAVHEKDNAAEFELDLAEQKRPTIESSAIPMRLIV